MNREEPSSKTYPSPNRAHRATTGAELAEAANSASASSPLLYPRNLSPLPPRFIREFIKQTVHSLRASGGPEIPRDSLRERARRHMVSVIFVQLILFQTTSASPSRPGGRLNFCAYEFLFLDRGTRFRTTSYECNIMNNILRNSE